MFIFITVYILNSVGAICHGVLTAARALVLKGRKSTCLPKYMERAAYFSTFWKIGKHYRTYDEYVEDEVKRLGAEIIVGPTTLFSRGLFFYSVVVKKSFLKRNHFVRN